MKSRKQNETVQLGTVVPRGVYDALKLHSAATGIAIGALVSRYIRHGLLADTDERHKALDTLHDNLRRFENDARK